MNALKIIDEEVDNELIINDEVGEESIIGTETRN